MSFNPCEDCGSSDVLLVVSVAVIWLFPIGLGAMRRFVAPDPEQEDAIGKVQRFVTVCALLLTAWLVSH